MTNTTLSPRAQELEILISRLEDLITSFSALEYEPDDKTGRALNANILRISGELLTALVCDLSKEITRDETTPFLNL